MFVHGFFGDCIETWGQFPDLCDSRDLGAGRDIWARSDLYFYDYGAEKDFVTRSASGLAQFLKRIFPRPEMPLFELPDLGAPKIRDPWLAYSRVILVGHSLGAVVIRECLQNQLRPSNFKEVPAWASVCELRLFAAAHLGFQCAGWKEFLFRMAPKYITSIPTISRAFNDLQKTSDVLVNLKPRTEELAQAHPQVAALLMYGSNEDFVTPGYFDCDPNLEWRDGHDHVTICKPDKKFLDPFEFVTTRVTTRTKRATRRPARA